MQINEKLALNIPEKEVDLCPINIELKKQGKQFIVEDLNKVAGSKSWFWILNELRNRSVHRGLLNKQFAATFVEDVNKGESYSTVKNYFLKQPDYRLPMDEDIISFLETNITNMRNLIDKIRKKLHQAMLPDKKNKIVPLDS
jgi:hypothetical protein